MKKWKFIILNILILAGCLYLTYEWHPTMHALGGLRIEADPDSISLKADDILSNFNIDRSDFSSELRFRQNKELIQAAQKKYGLKEANHLISRTIPGYEWDMHLTRQDNNEKSSPLGIDHIRMKFDTRGDLVDLKINLPDTLRLEQPDLAKARGYAFNFVKKYTPFRYIGQDEDTVDSEEDVSRRMIQSEAQSGSGQITAPQAQKMVYDFKWHVYIPDFDEYIKVKTTIKGQFVSDFEIDFFKFVPDTENQEIAHGILMVLFLILMAILVIYLAFIKSRNFEISFNLALKLALFMAVLVLLERYLDLTDSASWELLIVLLVVPVFTAGTFIVAFAVGESLGRETWREKIIPLDLITKGHITHSKIGNGILSGMTIGAVSFTVVMVLSYLTSQITGLTVNFSIESTIGAFSNVAPSFMTLAHGFWTGLYFTTINALILTSFIFSRTRNKYLAILLVGATYPIVLGYAIFPYGIGFLVQLIGFLILAWTFYRFDFFTTLIAMVTFMSLDYLPVFGTEVSALLVFGLLGVIFALFSILSRDSITDFTKIEPAIARTISERQHMKQQLEIAREVQSGLLPRSRPVFKGLEFAAACLPAYEVGGDYYDFIRIDADRIALAIGDVSGKGTKAAFYMTLVKGFLKALARSIYSPAEILKEINTLFFENTRHDAFISMIYAVFDLKKKQLDLARSGHNPVIHYQSQAQKINIIRGDGLALGLEKGELFDKLIEESHIALNQGDIFVFYTDGLSEAMSKHREEYSESRLEQYVAEHNLAGAEQLLNGIFKDIKKFCSGAKQHDDMTIIIVKVKYEL